jgi:hypothetical protein
VTTFPLARVLIPETESQIVRLPSIITKSVAFVGYRFSEGDQSCIVNEDATAFYFALTANSGNPAHKFCYFVTSKHSADKQKQHGGEPGFVVNTRDGLRKFIARSDPWYSHPTADNVDVSVTPIKHDPVLDVWPIDPGMFLRKEMFEGFPDGFVGLGSEVFFPGLFQFVPGDKKVLPLVRTET